jgi:hypothetical protein
MTDTRLSELTEELQAMQSKFEAEINRINDAHRDSMKATMAVIQNLQKSHLQQLKKNRKRDAQMNAVSRILLLMYESEQKKQDLPLSHRKFSRTSPWNAPLRMTNNIPPVKRAPSWMKTITIWTMIPTTRTLSGWLALTMGLAGTINVEFNVYYGGTHRRATQ